MNDTVICRSYALPNPYGGISFSYYHEACYEEDKERLSAIDASMPYYVFNYRSLKIKEMWGGHCSSCGQPFHKGAYPL